jgi:hypothetical protein
MLAQDRLTSRGPFHDEENWNPILQNLCSNRYLEKSLDYVVLTLISERCNHGMTLSRDTLEQIGRSQDGASVLSFLLAESYK